MRLLVLPCDGIGPEITGATMQVLEAADQAFGLGLQYKYDDVGFKSLEKYGTTLREEVLERAKAYDGIILGPQSHVDYPPPEKGGPQCLGRVPRRPRPLRECAPGAHPAVPRA